MNRPPGLGSDVFFVCFWAFWLGLQIAWHAPFAAIADGLFLWLAVRRLRSDWEKEKARIATEAGQLAVSVERFTLGRINVFDQDAPEGD